MLISHKSTRAFVEHQYAAYINTSTVVHNLNLKHPHRNSL
jgi:hypothetical protein